ncbi:unnamed protein product [Parajaminaea phylloscopi]
MAATTGAPATPRPAAPSTRLSAPSATGPAVPRAPFFEAWNRQPTPASDETPGAAPDAEPRGAAAPGQPPPHTHAPRRPTEPTPSRTSPQLDFQVFLPPSSSSPVKHFDQGDYSAGRLRRAHTSAIFYEGTPLR